MEAAAATAVVQPMQTIESEPTHTSQSCSQPSSRFAPPTCIMPPMEADERQAPRSRSPECSTLSSTLSSVSATPPPQLDGTNDGPPPAKRRKLTPSERAAREAEKNEKRAQREDEKRVRDEERRVKNEGIEARKRERDIKRQKEEEEKARKDEEKAKKEEEKAKKERAQTRINGFFTKPSGFVKEKSLPVESLPNVPSSVPARPKNGADRDKLVGSSGELSDYQKSFLPFAAPSNARMAPFNRFFWDLEATKLAIEKAERWLSDQSHMSQPIVECLELGPLECGVRGFEQDETKEVVRRIESTPTHFDLTTNRWREISTRAHLQEQLVMKHIFFSRDVRPPYVGTVSQVRTRRDLARLGRNPFRPAHEELDYDYDSEAEWEEPEEGEDLNSDNEDDAESEQDPADIDEFLDDDDVDQAGRSKRKALFSDMQPLSTGVCWEDERGRLVQDGFDNVIDPRQFCMEILCENVDGPIDPFSTSYWPKSTSTSTTRPDKAIAEHSRLPLEVRPALSLNNLLPPSATKASKPTKPAKPTRILEGRDLDQFKQYVEGSDLTKGGLLAVLKKRLPKVANAVLADTLNTVAARLGAKEADKRWKVL